MFKYYDIKLETRIVAKKKKKDKANYGGCVEQEKDDQWFLVLARLGESSTQLQSRVTIDTNYTVFTKAII